MGDDDELSFLLFHHLGDCVAAGAQRERFLGRRLLLAGDLRLSLRLQARALLQLRLRAVLLEHLEELDGGLLVQRLRELVDWWRDLQALLQDGLVALDADVLRPSHESRQIALGLNVLA